MKTYHAKISSKVVVRRRIAAAIVLTLVVAVIVLLTLLLKASPRNSDPEYLHEVQIPNWISVQYIDMDAGNARNGALLEEINGIVVHYVANPGTSAERNRSYFNNKGTTVFAHFIVGLEGEIIQCAPLYERSAASNNRNIDTISIEVCHPDESGIFTQPTYDALVRLCAWLSAECNFKQDDIIRHYDVTGKLCPKYFVEHEDAWKQFKTAVMKEKKQF